MPKYTLKFDSISTPKTKTSEFIDFTESPAFLTLLEKATSSIQEIPYEESTESLPSEQKQQQSVRHPCDPQLPAEHLNRNQDKEKISNHVSPRNEESGRRVYTTYVIDRMASDGENLMYSSTDDAQKDRIAYHFFSKTGTEDPVREWNQPSIMDMVWWSSIRKFICASSKGIYTVEYANGKFKINCMVRDNWSYIRVAVNDTNLWLWINGIKDNFDGCDRYSTDFQRVQSIEFNRADIRGFVDKSGSFCVTNSVVASICTRIQNNHEVFQVNFCDLNMNKLETILLGRCTGNIEIRSDGQDKFFITTGKNILLIVSLNGNKRTIDLLNNGGSLAILHNQTIAVTNDRSDVELINW